MATVGIAMGTAGAEAANVALMADDLEKVPYAINLSKRARGIRVRIMSVAIAVFVHETSELLAFANGLRVARS